MAEKLHHLDWLFVSFTLHYAIHAVPRWLFSKKVVHFRAQRECISHRRNQIRRWHCFPRLLSPGDGTGSTRARRPLAPPNLCPCPTFRHVSLTACIPQARTGHRGIISQPPAFKLMSVITRKRLHRHTHQHSGQ